jgi:predicted metal-dependent phosphoesterase TrpH
MHTWFSADCGTPPSKLLQRALKVGLNCIAVTEHNNVKGALEVQRLAQELGDSIKVIVAEEVRTPYGEITGFFLKEGVPPGLSPQETVKRIKEQGGLVSIPHPFDRLRGSPLRRDMLEAILPEVDIMEVFNARTTFLADCEKAKAFAKAHHLAPGAGSDAHHPLELGHVYVEIPDFSTPQEFKAALNHARIYAKRSSPLFHVVSRYFKWYKKLLRVSHV